MGPPTDISSVEREFNINLARIYDKGAHKSGIQECQKIIREHSHSQEAATVFLKALTDAMVTKIQKQNAPNENSVALPFVAHISLIGLMAEAFRLNFVMVNQKEPSVAKTVKKVVQSLKEMFFGQSSELIRQELAKTLIGILENCFIQKRYGAQNQRAKDLIIQPLFDELQKPQDMTTRQTACYVLHKFNAQYMQDPDIVNILHCHTLTAFGIKHKIYD